MTQQSKHTQGPWIIVWPENHGISPRIKSDSFGTICRMNDVWPTENGFAENKANTYLVAAAPDLLAALENALESLTVMEGNMNSSEWKKYSGLIMSGIDGARKAINKAKEDNPL